MKKTLFLLILITICGACSTSVKEESKAHPASYLGDIFAIDNGMPIREIQKKDFYFKKCDLETRRPFQSKVEYSCNEP